MATEVSLTTGFMVRRAWMVLVIASGLFTLLVTGTASAAYVYHRNAMEPREGRLATAGEVLLQPRNETKFKQVRDGEPVREGDTIKTQGGMPATLVFFDGSQLQLAEGALVSVEELRSSRFVNNEKRIQVVQQAGWTRLLVRPATDYRVGHYLVRLNGMDVETLSQVDRGAEVSFELRKLIERPADLEQAGPLEARVAVHEGTASVQAEGDQVTLMAGQAATLADGGHVTPAPLPLEYAHNGSFRDLTLKLSRDKSSREIFPQWWTETFDQGGDGGEQWGTTKIVPEEIDGQSTPVVVFERRVNAKDNALNGIQQQLDLPLNYFRSLRLSVTARVRYQSLSGGGVADSEYPIMVKITYRDRKNRSVAWIRGFYTHNEEKLPIRIGIKEHQDEWFTFSQDLLQLVNEQGDGEPVFLETLDIYASGHDFESAVASVSIAGE